MPRGFCAHDHLALAKDARVVKCMGINKVADSEDLAREVGAHKDRRVQLGLMRLLISEC